MKPALMIAIMILAAAAPPSYGDSGGGILNMNFLKKKLNMDKSQEIQMQMLLFAYEKEAIKIDGEIRYQQLEFHELLSQDEVDSDALDAKFKSITALQAGFGVMRIRKLLKAELKLKTIRTGRPLYVKEAVNLLAAFVYNNIRKLTLIPGISHFIVGGKDSTGCYVYDIAPDGSLADIDDYVSSGSGSVMAYGVLETLYSKNIDVNEGVRLVVKSINAAVQRDIASGNGIDVVTITKDGVKKVISKEISYKIEA